MTATLVLPGTASEADWHAARRQGITASDIAPLMGLSNWTSPYALYHRKVGNLPEQESDLSMRVGHHMESFVAGLFAEQRPELAQMGDGRQLYGHPGRPWQMATPDRVLYEHIEGFDVEYGERGPVSAYGDLLAVLECKTDSSYDGWGEDGSDEIPVKYRCQVLWQCDVLGVDAWFVACLFMHSRKLRVYHGTLDGQALADLNLMREEAEAFLARIEARDEPDVDWRPSTASALKALHPDVEDTDVPVSAQLAGWYHAACRNLKAAEQKRDLYVNRLRQHLGSGHRVTDRAGQVIARRDVYDQKEYLRKASHVDRIVPVYPKAEKETPKP